jgi:hypothetical protein
MKKLLILLILVMPTILFGQKKLIPVNISFFNENTAIPFTKFLTFPIHPGMQVGSEYTYKIKEHSRLFQTVNVCYFYHNYLAQGIGINTELGYEYQFKFGLAFEALLGIGYMHTFAVSEEFVFRNGQYVLKPDYGNPRLYPSLSFDAGYYLKKSDKSSPKIFLRYQSWAEYPYSPDFIPVMTHINLHLGVKFFINLKTKSND